MVPSECIIHITFKEFATEVNSKSVFWNAHGTFHGQRLKVICKYVKYESCSLSVLQPSGQVLYRPEYQGVLVLDVGDELDIKRTKVSDYTQLCAKE